MTNAEKFEEVFGFKPNKNLCYAPENVECPRKIVMIVRIFHG